MKKIVIFLMAALALSGCKKDEISYSSDQSGINVSKSDILFDAPGGVGTITLSDIAGSVKAVSASEWCQVSVSGNVVTVTAAPNQTLEGRASRITLTSGSKSSYITAQQRGMEYSFVNASYLVEMAGGEVTVSGSSSFSVEASADVDWIKVTEFDGGYKLAVAANDSGNSREGTFTVKCGDIVTTYSIKQKFDRVFTGEYQLNFYTNYSKSTPRTLSATFERDAEDPDLYYISGISSQNRIPIKYDPATEMLVIENGAYCGPYGENLWEYALVSYATSDFSGTYYSVSTLSAYNIYFTYTYNAGKYSLDLYDSAPMFNSARTSLGFSLYAFNVGEGNTLTASNKKSTILSVVYPSFKQQ